VLQVFIKFIEWLDEENREAEVMVTDGVFDVLCFSHPFNKTLNDVLTEPLYCLDANQIVISNEQVAFANKGSISYGYSICGKLIDKKKQLILLGKIMMCLDSSDIPKDICEGDFIEFSVLRLDLI
jgi:hypothetical protein